MWVAVQVRGGTGGGLVCGTDERFQLDSEPVIFILDVLNRLFEDRAAQLSAAGTQRASRGD